MEKWQPKIDGMHCGSCAIGIQMILDGIDGVESASVDYDSKSGDVEFDPDKVSKETMITSIEELGYKVST